MFRNKIFTLEEIQAAQFVLIPGAGLRRNQLPTHILEDRLITGIKYLGKFSVEKVIISGSAKYPGYNEPYAMSNYLVNKGVRKDSLELDEFGISTFDSLVNFKKQHKDGIIIIISQKFHLTRALMIGKLLRIECSGLIADNISFSIPKKFYWYLREILATPYNIAKYFVFIIS